MVYTFFKGATAYETQIHRYYIRIVHLSGGYWVWWAPWRRVSCGIDHNL